MSLRLSALTVSTFAHRKTPHRIIYSVRCPVFGSQSANSLVISNHPYEYQPFGLPGLFRAVYALPFFRCLYPVLSVYEDYRCAFTVSYTHTAHKIYCFV